MIRWTMFYDTNERVDNRAHWAVRDFVWIRVGDPIFPFLGDQRVMLNGWGEINS